MRKEHKRSAINGKFGSEKVWHNAYGVMLGFFEFGFFLENLGFHPWQKALRVSDISGSYPFPIQVSENSISQAEASIRKS